MGKKIKFLIKEEISELISIKENLPKHLSKRIDFLILQKRFADHSKNKLASLLFVNPNSIQIWRDKYKSGGIEELLKDKRTCHKKEAIDAATQKKIDDMLSKREGKRIYYTRILNCINRERQEKIKYITLVKFIKRKYPTLSIKEEKKSD